MNVLFCGKITQYFVEHFICIIFFFFLFLFLSLRFGWSAYTSFETIPIDFSPIIDTHSLTELQSKSIFIVGFFRVFLFLSFNFNQMPIVFLLFFLFYYNYLIQYRVWSMFIYPAGDLMLKHKFSVWNNFRSEKIHVFHWEWIFTSWKWNGARMCFICISISVWNGFKYRKLWTITGITGRPVYFKRNLFSRSLSINLLIFKFMRENLSSRKKFTLNRNKSKQNTIWIKRKRMNIQK